MSVFFWREHAQDVVVLMDWFAVVPSLLLVPPVGVWVTKLAWYSWGVDIASVLKGLGTLARRMGKSKLKY